MIARPSIVPLLGLLYLSLLPLVLSASTVRRGCPAETRVTTSHVVPGTQSLENIAIRHNGDILVTSVTSSTLFSLSARSNHPPVPLIEVPDVSGLTGVAELERDVFYVIGTNLTSTEGSNGVWKVDLRNFKTTNNGDIIEPPKISLITLVPSALQLNGISRLTAKDPRMLLISDSSRGTVLRLDVETGAYETVLQEPEMGPLSEGLNIGVNGIRVRDDHLYFVSLDQELFAKVPISTVTGRPEGPVQVLATGIPFGDDFALSKDGKWAYVATNGPETIYAVDLVHEGKTAAARSPLLGSASSVALGPCHSCETFFSTGAITSGNSTIGHVAFITLGSRL